MQKAPIHRRADSPGAVASGKRDAGRGDLPEIGGHGDDVLPVEEAVH